MHWALGLPKMKSGHGSPCGFWSLRGHGAFPSVRGQEDNAVPLGRSSAKAPRTQQLPAPRQPSWNAGPACSRTHWAGCVRAVSAMQNTSAPGNGEAFAILKTLRVFFPLKNHHDNKHTGTNKNNKTPTHNLQNKELAWKNGIYNLGLGSPRGRMKLCLVYCCKCNFCLPSLLARLGVCSPLSSA